MKLNDFINKYGDKTVYEEELKEFLGIKNEKYFMPEEDERYFVVNMLGEVYQGMNSSDVGAERTRYNEVFRTVEEAEEHARKQSFLLQMKRDFLDSSDDIDWENDEQEKLYLAYEHGYGVVVCYSHIIQRSPLVTTNKEWLIKYILEHEEEIEKYYFEVETC